MINTNKGRQVVYGLWRVGVLVAILCAVILTPITSFAVPVGPDGGPSAPSSNVPSDQSCTGTGETLTTNADGSINCNCPGGSANQIVAFDGTQQCKNVQSSSTSTCSSENYQCANATCQPTQDTTSTCGDKAAQSQTCTSSSCDLVQRYINPTVSLLSALVGVVAVIGIITGGIQYSTSEGDPQKAAKAKGRIMNSVIAIVAFTFLYAFLQFIIPGGLFNG